MAPAGWIHQFNQLLSALPFLLPLPQIVEVSEKVPAGGEDWIAQEHAERDFHNFALLLYVNSGAATSICVPPDGCCKERKIAEADDTKLSKSREEKESNQVPPLSPQCVCTEKTNRATLEVNRHVNQ